MRDGRYEDAAADFLAVQKAAPGEPASLMYLGEVFGRLGRLDRAVKLFTAVSWSRPKDALVLAYLSQAKRRLGETEGGLEDLGRAVALDPARLWMTSLGYGRAPNREFYLRESENLASILRRRPSWGLARVAHGLAKAHAGTAAYGEIRADFDAALALDPGLSWSRAWLAEVCRAAGRHEEAVTLLDAWLAERPGDADALLRRGESRAVTGPFSAALADFDRAVALRPDSSFALAWRGEAKLWAGDYAGALDDCARAVSAAEPALWARCWRGAALLMLGRIPHADAELSAALREDPADAEAWTWRGEARLRAGRAAAAAKDLDRALAQRELLGARIVRALARTALGDEAGAESDFAAARALGPALFALAAKGARGRRRTLEAALNLSLGNRTVLPTFAGGKGGAFRLFRASGPRP
jgi:tetratricopeptide (TPR) repeat protein